VITREEAQRIAASGAALRPRWSQEQILGVLLNDRICRFRTPADTAAALARLALDPDTRQPTRLLEAGPWWTTTGESKPLYRKPEPTDCHHCHKPAHPDLPGDHDYLALRDFRPQPTPMPEQAREHLAEVVEAWHQEVTAERPPEPEKPPAPPVTETLAKHQPTEQETRHA
jgi:hypothetical protein